jgi:hypothetical protein
MKLKTQTNTQVAVNYHTCTYNTVRAQYIDLASTASTVSEKCSVRQVLHDSSDYLKLTDLPLFFIPTLTLQLFLSLRHCLIMYCDSCCKADSLSHMDTTY